MIYRQIRRCAKSVNWAARPPSFVTKLLLVPARDLIKVGHSFTLKGGSVMTDMNQDNTDMDYGDSDSEV